MTADIPEPVREPDAGVPDTTVATRDSVLVNREYWLRVWARVAKKEKPTVRDVIAAMREEGNGAYYDHDYKGDGKISSLFLLSAREPALAPANNEGEPTRMGHELSHIVPEAGHTAQHEMLNCLFQEGFYRGWGVFDDAHVKEEIDEALLHFQREGLKYQSEPPELPSARTKAIYFALGLYFRDKVDAYEMHGYFEKEYDAQLAFCQDYAKKDYEPPPKDWTPPPGQEDLTDVPDALLDAPASILMFSDKERRAIIATATGLCDSLETPYPKRMTAIQKALDHTGLFYDLSTKVERTRGRKASDTPPSL